MEIGAGPQSACAMVLIMHKCPCYTVPGLFLSVYRVASFSNLTFCCCLETEKAKRLRR